MTLLTAAECREIADRKMMEAAGDRLQGKEFRATAWLFLADKIEQAEALEAQRRGNNERGHGQNAPIALDWNTPIGYWEYPIG